MCDGGFLGGTVPYLLPLSKALLRLSVLPLFPDRFYDRGAVQTPTNNCWIAGNAKRGGPLTLHAGIVVSLSV